MSTADILDFLSSAETVRDCRGCDNGGDCFGYFFFLLWGTFLSSLVFVEPPSDTSSEAPEIELSFLYRGGIRFCYSLFYYSSIYARFFREAALAGGRDSRRGIMGVSGTFFFLDRFPFYTSE